MLLKLFPASANSLYAIIGDPWSSMLVGSARVTEVVVELKYKGWPGAIGIVAA